MSVSDELPNEVEDSGAKAIWMEGNIAILAKISGSRREACVIECNVYVAIRCQMRKEIREFQLK